MQRLYFPSLLHSRQRLVLVGCEQIAAMLRVEFALFGRNLSQFIVVEGKDEHQQLHSLKLAIPPEFQDKKEGYQEHVFFDILGSLAHAPTH